GIKRHPLRSHHPITGKGFPDRMHPEPTQRRNMKTKKVLCGILMAAAAAFPFRVQAGTLFYVPIPATGSDAQSGLDPAKVYTSAIAAGNVKAEGRTVNGAALVPLAGSGNTWTANGVTLSAATGSL